MSLVEIWNVALARVGEGQTVAEPNEQTEPARQCNLFWQHALERSLRAFDWPFARRRVAAVAMANLPGGWEVAYAYPPDAVCVRRLLADDAQSSVDFRVIGVTVGDTDSRLIAPVQKAAWIEYTRRVTDPTQFDPGFRDVVAWALASDLASLRQEDPRARETAVRGYLAALLQAVEQAAYESRRTDRAGVRYLDARS